VLWLPLGSQAVTVVGSELPEVIWDALAKLKRFEANVNRVNILTDCGLLDTKIELCIREGKGKEL